MNRRAALGFLGNHSLTDLFIGLSVCLRNLGVLGTWDNTVVKQASKDSSAYWVEPRGCGGSAHGHVIWYGLVLIDRRKVEKG